MDTSHDIIDIVLALTFLDFACQVLRIVAQIASATERFEIRMIMHGKTFPNRAGA